MTTDPGVDEAPFGVSTARDLVRGLLGLGVSVLALLCAGGLHGDGWRIVQIVGVSIGAFSTWLVTRQRDGARHNPLRRVVRGLGVLFLVAELVYFDVPWLDALDLVFQVPFVVALGVLVFSHVRPGTRLRRRLWADTALATGTLGALWALNAVAWLTTLGGPVREGIYAFVVWSAVVSGLVLAMRLPDTLRGLMPPEVRPAWRSLAEQRGWEVVRDDPGAWSARSEHPSFPVRVTIQRDPVPAVTLWTVSVPHWEGLWVRGRRPSDPRAPWSGDEVLDAALWVEGETHGLLEDVDAHRAAWLRVVRTWGGAVQDGVLTLRLPGGLPHGGWVRATDDPSEEEVLAEIVDGLERVVAGDRGVSPARSGGDDVGA